MISNDAPLAVTMGDPCGIGPEIIAKMYVRRPEKRHWIVVGDPPVIKHAFAALHSDVPVRPISEIDEAVFDGTCLNVLASSHLLELPPIGQVSAVAGKAVKWPATTLAQSATSSAFRLFINPSMHARRLPARRR